MKEKIYSHSEIKFFDSLSLNSRMFASLIAYIINLYNKQEPIIFHDTMQVVLQSECEQ